jgi:hypothetical protein
VRPDRDRIASASLTSRGAADASVDDMRPISREAIVDRRQPFMRWGAVFAGTVLAVGLWVLLQTLGMGAGLAAVDTDEAGSLKGAGIGTGIWSIIASLIAMFIGAILAGRLAGTREPKVGAMHGSVMWALATGIGLWAMFSVVSSLASGAARMGSAAAGATSSVISGAVAGGDNVRAAGTALGIDASDLVAPINERLRAQGKPGVTADQLNATARAVAQRGVREGKLDREVLVEELARNTQLSRADAEDIANQFGARYEEMTTQLGTRVDELGEQAKHAALEAADKTGKALLVGGMMMLLSLGAAVGGGFLGARSTARQTVIRPPLETAAVPPVIVTDDAGL